MKVKKKETKLLYFFVIVKKMNVFDHRAGAVVIYL